jgi:RimJ/RimL family protein N-acetyltransferase
MTSKGPEPRPRIRLEPFIEEDIPTLIGWISTPEFLLLWGGPSFTFPLTEKQLTWLIGASARKTPEILALRAVESETGAVVGHIQIMAIDRQNRSARLGRVLIGPEERRGQGLGLEMVRAALRIAFDTLQIHRVDLFVFDFNTRAIACYKRAGFRTEGRLRDARRSGDSYWSLVVMSILEDEWRSEVTGRH